MSDAKVVKKGQFLFKAGDKIQSVFVIQSGQLTLDFGDGERRIGDCCSLGVIRVRYRLQNGIFISAGRTEKDAVRPIQFANYGSGPGTVAPSAGRGIVYTDLQGARHNLTSGSDSDPSLSVDKKSVVFVRGQKEVWTVGIDGSTERKTFTCSTAIRCRLPQFDPEGRFIFVVVDDSDDSGGIWRIDRSSGQPQKLIPDSSRFAVLKGLNQGLIIADQRTVENSASGEPYPAYTFFLFTSAGRKLRKIGEDFDDLDALVEQFRR